MKYLASAVAAAFILRAVY